MRKKLRILKLKIELAWLRYCLSSFNTMEKEYALKAKIRRTQRRMRNERQCL